MPKTYEVEIVGETVPYGAKRANAVNYARRISEKYPDDIAYVVVSDEGERVGHIAYCRGFRDHIEGRA